MSQYLDRLKSEIRQHGELSKLPKTPFGSFDSAKGRHHSENVISDNSANTPAERPAEQSQMAGGGVSEKQILLDFAKMAGGVIHADSHFAQSRNHLILGARRPGLRKILRPLSVYEYRLAAEAGRRTFFCENHRQKLGGFCQHFEVMERLAPGDQTSALHSCLLWRLVISGQFV